MNCNLCDKEYMQGYRGYCSINCYVYDRINEEITRYAEQFKDEPYCENGDTINNIFDIFTFFSKDLFPMGPKVQLLNEQFDISNEIHGVNDSNHFTPGN